ncbi:MAG: ribbon-helix-helix protein, CopG family [Rhodobacteraceae bacterium]|nr:ribbon-helix-helix protein, CopG family [Paracoccaceae bacterium]
MPKPSPTSVPVLTTDKQAEDFLDQDLSDLDFAQFKPMPFEALPKSALVTMRLPEPLIAALKARAKDRGIPYQRLIREALEQALTKP